MFMFFFTDLSLFYINLKSLSLFYFIFVKFNSFFFYFFNSKLLLNFFLIFSFYIYIFGLIGLILNLKNILISLLFVELTYFGIITFVLAISLVNFLVNGFIFALLLILAAASESAVGLGILICVFTFEKKITFDFLVELR